MNTLTDIKNQYAQEQGYEDWNDLRKEFREKAITFTEMTGHENAVIIRAQKAALEKAAESAMVQHHNTRTGTKTHASGMGSNGQVYTVDRTSITNPENLIR